jgi:hypothetical protein
MLVLHVNIERRVARVCASLFLIESLVACEVNRELRLATDASKDDFALAERTNNCGTAPSDGFANSTASPL